MPAGRIRALDRASVAQRTGVGHSPGILPQASMGDRFLRSVSVVALGLRQSVPQDLCEHDSFVVLAIAGAVDERQRAGPRLAPERRQPRTLTAKLLDVASAKRRKAARLVPKPLPQLGARRQLLLPAIQLGPLARNPARPEPVDQHATAIRGCRRLVGALQADVHTRHRVTSRHILTPEQKTAPSPDQGGFTTTGGSSANAIRSDQGNRPPTRCRLGAWLPPRRAASFGLPWGLACRDLGDRTAHRCAVGDLDRLAVVGDR